MKTYSCVITIDIDEEDGYDHPAKWQWDELIGSGVQSVTVYDVTESPIERARLTATGVEES